MYDAVMALNVSVISFAVNSGKLISDRRVAFSIASCGPLAMVDLRVSAHSLAQKLSGAYVPSDHSPESLLAPVEDHSHLKSRRRHSWSHVRSLRSSEIGI